MNNKRVIAIHLPQYYPFKENDEWWGKGFTEWRNVASAKPRFRNHNQPHIPADLGFYDLRLAESRKAQQDLAKEYGIYGFCYYHYWFNGKLIMEKPVEAMLANKNEDLPFMLCWANENWNRNWEGGHNVILIKQDYNIEDDIDHFKYLLPYFKDPNYIRIDGKPVFCIHRIDIIPNLQETIDRWQDMAQKEGFRLYICTYETDIHCGDENKNLLIDAVIEFQPFRMGKYRKSRNILARIANRILKKEKLNLLYSYKSYVNYQCKQSVSTKYKRYPSIFPTWDNSPRRVNRVFMAFKGSTPELFEKWFRHLYTKFIPFSKEENLIFINAWNEWAEGCHLEPDLKSGTGYLDAIKKIIDEN